MSDDYVQFRDQRYAAQKGFWDGTQRTVAPEQTWERIRPTFPIAGLTRVANITGLDRLGIPVMQSVRPNSQSLTVSSGKGFSNIASKVSAAMEGIELFHAEQVEFAEVRCPWDALGNNRIPIEDLPLTRNSLFTPRLPIRWTDGWDLLAQEEVPVPCSVVQMGTNRRRLLDLHSFQLTSNGLASGNSMLEAINAAMFEVIERDAVTCHRVAWKVTKIPPPVVDLNSIEHPMVLELLDQFRRAELRVVLFDCTVDTEVPTYMAYVQDLVLRNVGVYRGYGAHLDPEIAMIRTLTEAAQSRAIYIAGSRDDAFRHSYLRLKEHDGDAASRSLDALPVTVDGRDRKSEATPSFHGDTLLALSKLRAVGIDRVIVLDLSREDFPINVVKIVIPGLEGYMFDFYIPGPRAQAFIAQRQAS
ncbi:MAG: YcaO-like family protein [Actinomycetota bacterium]|nr:YcaO-like family protein [Actinomycetota bacterium]